MTRPLYSRLRAVRYTVCYTRYTHYTRYTVRYARYTRPAQGGKVMIHGLQGATQFNYKWGHLKRFDTHMGRWEVTLTSAVGGQDTILCKPANLIKA